MVEELMNSQELHGSVIPSPLLGYCMELSERWRQQGKTDLAIMATEAGMVVCSPAVPQTAQMEWNNVKRLLAERLQKDVLTAYASAANIRTLLNENEHGRAQVGSATLAGSSTKGGNLSTVDKTRAQQTLTDLVADAVAMQASDIHLRFTPNIAYLNFRVRGRLVGAQRRSREAMVESIAAALNTYSDDYCEVFNESSSDSASIEVSVNEGDHNAAQTVRLRVQKSPLRNGFSVTLRLLPERPPQMLSFEQLNLAPDIQAALRMLCNLSHGLVLIVGATGHGKTTTLATLNREFGDSKKVISLEDPIEIVQQEIEQRWVDSQSDSFAEHIKVALREDPDVISVSEIRDQATAQASVTAALTGHLVTATLHAHDCIGAVQRLQNLGIPINELIAEGVLQGIVAQHLSYHQEQVTLTAEYVIIDHPARRFLRRGDYSGWRQHLFQHGWQSMTQRWRQRCNNSKIVAEHEQVYHYDSAGPRAR